MNALAGVRVVELGHGIAVGYCGALLAACGADVVKVEPPGRGDAARRLPPYKEGVAAPEASGMHAFLSANKLGIALDLDDRDGSDLVRRLSADADVMLEAMGPGVAEALGLGHSALAAGNRKLVTTAISWFGSDGPRRDWVASDAIVQALAGFIYPIGEKEGPPIVPGGYQAQITGGVTAFIATMSALIGCLNGDDGVLIDQSIEAQTTYTETAGVRAAYDPTPSVRKGLNKFQPTYPQTLYPAADGWIGVTVLTPLQWRGCCNLIGAPELIDDPRFRTSKDRNERADELEAILVPLFRKRPALEWFHEAQAQRVPFALVPTLAEMADLDHFQARGVLADYEHPDLGRFAAATIPWKLLATPLLAGGAAPRLGQHTREVLSGRLGLSAAEVQHLADSGTVALGSPPA